uniref:Glycine cleavage system transcriptional repressor n=1 Tax=Oxyrrhis marina TaxID=2969 RepID=A0A7S3URK3_OXYMA
MLRNIQRLRFPGLAPYARAFSSSPAADVCILLGGENKPGVVNSLLKDVVSPNGGNVGRTRMARVGGDFAVIARVLLPRDKLDSLKSDLSSTFPEYVTGVREIKAAQPAQTTVTLNFSFVGPDSFQILEKITGALLEKNADLLNVTSESSPGSHVGYDIFDTMISCALPSGTDRLKVYQEIEDIASEMGLACTLED